MCGRFQHLVSSAAAPLRSARGRGCEQKEGATFSSQPPGSGPLRPPVFGSPPRGALRVRCGLTFPHVAALVGVPELSHRRGVWEHPPHPKILEKRC